MERRIKRVSTRVLNQNIETLPERLHIVGDLEVEVLYIDWDGIIKCKEHQFSFNHSFPLPGLRLEGAVQGKLEIEHSTSSLKKDGEEVQSDYLLKAEIFLEGFPRHIEERFLLQHGITLPRRQIHVVGKRQPTVKLQRNHPSKKQDPDQESTRALEEKMETSFKELKEEIQASFHQLEEEIEYILLQNLELKIQQRLQETQETMNPQYQRLQWLQEKKDRIRRKSTEQRIHGFSTRGQKK